MFQSPPTRHAKNQPDTSADQRHAELTQLGPSWSTNMSTFNHPEKPEKFDQPKKTHTWFPPDKIAVCGCVWLFWGGKEKQLFLTQTSAKKRLKKSVQAAKIMAQDHCSALIFSCTWRWLKARPKVLLHLGSVSHNWGSWALLGLMGWTRLCYWWPLRE